MVSHTTAFCMPGMYGERSCCTQDTLNCSGLLTGNLVIVPKGTLNVHAHATGKTLRLTFVEPSSGGLFSPRSKERKNEVQHSTHCMIVW